MTDILKFILTNQLTEENAPAIIGPILAILSDHDRLIRELALWVSKGNAGTGSEREKILGVYADDVQNKINWAYAAAKDVWAGKYGSGDARRKALGTDYDLVQYWVDITRPAVYVPPGMKYRTEKNGKRYVLPDVPTAKGRLNYIGFDQHAQGVSNIDGSGCGYCSALIPAATFADPSVMPATYFQRMQEITGGKCPVSMMAIQKILDDFGIIYTWIKGAMTTQKAHDTLLAHLRKGMPAIVTLVHTNRAGKAVKAYTNANHYATLIGIVAGEKTAYLYDSGGRKPRYVDLWDISEYIPGCKEDPDYSPVWNGWSNCGGILLINL